ncbi:MAG: phosphoribosylaminoimidazolesuccinocarboxamide synthase [Gemmatimonadetes bacterium]|uniref:Phosphoribosylaminoimidazole-succinocarboxamide synthase n=1 Tax=Candidatus Kutchimonas denitrificans TaxID=3056748 RepID=A0AAE4Z6C1_9BACT|nr:phosphoribosylaminoimidazolesuccinocarboxamide synthase [Gemmatimonadota bacterium]NIR74600.1 phosphoribosylaminoimidazolesuccinocarboxamide synthase [Candidatus Kutchimonas denitrificans]NIS02790.1 phosphoribosylaminoimidazolesuccinocarboxamide synthase [Gemmatimonadota bacterium]NIT68951.1 phosphoribosylaminoimidazolesuccinocarboxamide synthase [Gemmatimonadota bacterium]NIU52256.1 phosphoribosylaminoimidazolesuccinocarboxamide synthase [Gemmatimonadota bacterium]
MSLTLRNVNVDLPLFCKGKVREVYELGEDLLLVASDRISAFDVVLNEPIPHKGRVLTQLSRWWFEHMDDIVVNHLISADADEIIEREPKLAKTRDRWEGRSMLVRRTDPFPVECVVRGYITGSAWREYQDNGTLAGEKLPEGLIEAQKLEPPIFSPATKATEGHDENITFEDVCRMVGVAVATTLRDISLALYARARDIAHDGGVILADTKFEFGVSADGEILLIDEVLTPDSSRFWLVESYTPGQSQQSFDKQPVRDYLDLLVAKGEWNKEPPPPDLPREVVESTSKRYLKAYELITGHPLPVPK